ncbi:MAG: PAS domain S-box protein [Myxococcales bacterium]|nr:MAG: PAS domain S-box protein [Myxococcales bacterium]
MTMNVQRMHDPLWETAEALRAQAGALEEVCEALTPEKARAESEPRLDQIIRFIHDAVVITVEGECVMANQPAARLLGAETPLDLIGRDSLDFVHPDHRDFARAWVRLASSTRRAAPQIEQTMTRLDGSAIEVEAAAVPITVQGRKGILEIFRDISEARRAQHELRVVKENLAEAQRIGHFGSWDWNLRSKEIYWSDEMFRIYGQPKGTKPPFENWLEPIHPEDRASLKTALAEMMDDGRSRQIEYRVVRPTGEVRHCHSVWEIIYDEQERPARIVGAVLDITERKQAEAREARHKATLEFLYRSAMEIVDVSAEGDLFTYLFDKLQRLVPDSHIIITSIRTDDDCATVERVSLPDERANELRRLLGRELVGMQFRIDGQTRRIFGSGKLVRAANAIDYLINGGIPVEKAQAALDAFGIGSVYFMGLSRGGNLFGSVILATHRDRPDIDPHLVETFLSQAAIALQRQAAEKELRQSEERYRVLVESGEDPILLADAEGRILFCNDIGRKAFDWSEDGWRNRHIADFIPDLRRERLIDEIRDVLATREGRILELVFGLEDERRWLRVSLQPIAGDSGRPDAAMLRITDISDEKLGEAELKRSEERLKILFEYAPDAYFLLDFNGKVTACNAAAEELIGFPQKQMLGRSYREGPICVPSQYPMVADIIAESLLGRPTGPTEFLLKARGGRATPVDVRTFPVVIADQPLILFSCRDITERKRMEARIRRQADFEALISSISARFINLGVDQIDTELESALGEIGRFMGAKSACLAHIDRKRGAFNLGREWRDSTHSFAELPQGPLALGDFGWLWEQLEAMQPLVFGSPESIPEACAAERALFGDRSPCLCVPMAYGKSLTGFLCFGELPAHDLWSVDHPALIKVVGEIFSSALEHMRAEREVLAQEEKYRALYELASDAILTIDPSLGRIVDGNLSAVHMLQFSKSELVQLSLHDLMAAETYPVTWGGWKRQLDRHGRFRGRTTLKRKDGGRVPVSVGGSTIELGGTKQLQLIARDIAEELRLEEERRTIDDQLREAQRLESLGVLAGGVAHDFNNLLTGILCHANLALADLGEDSEVRPMVREIEAAALAAAQLSNQMLAYSGKGKFVLQRLNLSTFIERMRPLIESVNAQKASLDFKLAADLPEIEADAAQLRQVVLNLISNAAEAIGDSVGTITLRTRLTAFAASDLGPRDLAAGLRPGQYAILEIADTGCGMDQSTLARVFDPFFSTKFTGRGLGLPVVQGIMRGHSGAIVATSQPDNGSQFCAYFPTSDGNRNAARSSRAKVDPWRGAGTILVVDDEETVRNVAKLILKRHGFDVLVAVDGLEALEIFSSNSEKITAVVLDMTMPGMSGEETFTELQRLRPGSKVILSSGYSHLETNLRSDSAGVAGFLPKPYQPAELISKLREVLEG